MFNREKNPPRVGGKELNLRPRQSSSQWQDSKRGLTGDVAGREEGRKKNARQVLGVGGGVKRKQMYAQKKGLGVFKDTIGKKNSLKEARGKSHSERFGGATC